MFHYLYLCRVEMYVYIHLYVLQKLLADVLQFSLVYCLCTDLSGNI